MIYDLMIIGAGPTGVEAILQADARGLTALLVEKNEVGSLIEETMNNKKFYHVYGRNTLAPKGLLAFPDRVQGAELVALWKQQVETMPVLRQTHVLGLKRDAHGVFTLSTTNGEHQGRAVLLTSGTFESPRKLGVEGEKGNPKILYALDYYTEYKDKKIVVVGGGNSALETAVYCAEANEVTMVVRKDQFAPSSAGNNLKAVNDLVEQGKLAVLFGAVVKSITPDTLTVQIRGESREIAYDLLFVHIGFENPVEFLERLGIECRDGKAVFNERLETNIPGLFIAGSLTGADSIVEGANQACDIVQAL